MLSNKLPSYKTWPAQFSGLAVFFVIILIFFFYVFFGSYMMPPLILLFGLTITFFFFTGLRFYSLKWSHGTLKSFYKKLFWHSFFYRLIFVGIMYLLTYFLDPNSYPFEINAADSWTYHLAGIRISESIPQGDFTGGALYYFKGRADLGFPIYIGVLYYLFGPYTVVTRIFNAIWGSLTVVYISKISHSIFGESQGRLAGIIAMLMPPFLWFGGMHLKETVMIFLIVSVFYHVTNIVKNGKFSFRGIAITIIFSFLLFYFRTFLAMLVIVCILLYFLLNLTKRNVNKGILFVSFLIFIVIVRNLINVYGFRQDINPILAESTARFETELADTAKERKISYNRAFVAPFIMVGAIVTPFPSFLDFEERQLAIYTQFQNELVRNIMYFFAFLGIYFSLRKRFRTSLLITTFSLGYILILTLSAVSFQSRFQLLSLPFMIMFMAEGFTTSKKPLVGKWIVYMCLIFIAIFAWNYFKLSIRNLI